jgi:Zn-dependent metalloprotease
MKAIKSVLCIFVILFVCLGAYSESLADLGNIKRSPSGSIWMKFKSDRIVLTQDAFTTNKKKFGLGSDDEMLLLNSEMGGSGVRHSRFQQVYKGIKVEGMQFILHEKYGKIDMANGNIAIGLSLNINPDLSEEAALKLALEEVKAIKYRWESDPAYLPKRELVITRKSGNPSMRPADFALMYKFNIYTEIPRDGVAVYVDAHTGKIVKKTANIRKDTGTACTLFDGSQNITTELTRPTWMYRLNDIPRYIHTLYTSVYPPVGVEITDADNIWCEPGITMIGASAHWAGEAAHDLTGYSPTFIFIDDSFYDNAAWEEWTNYLYLGKPYKYADKYLVSLDIVGHEFGHIYNYNTAHFDYEYESGALDESFADIWGEMIQYSKEADPADWINGKQVSSNPEFWRYLNDPNKTGPLIGGPQPDTYFGKYWKLTARADDNGGIHTNMGAHNFWFYLLSDGGSGTNDLGTAYSVTGIGRDTAFAIAKESLYYLYSNAEYWDAYVASIAAVIFDLYPDDPFILAQVENAWAAIGVPPVDMVWDYCCYYTGCHTLRGINSVTAGPYAACTDSTFVAGKQITLKPGFRFSSRPNQWTDISFSAHIDPDLDEILAVPYLLRTGD